MTCRILKLAVCTLSCAFSGVFAGPGLADGAAKFVGNIPVDGEVPADFAEYWNQISPDRECVWAQVEKDRGNYDFTKYDADLHAYRQGIYQAGTPRLSSAGNGRKITRTAFLNIIQNQRHF